MSDAALPPALSPALTHQRLLEMYRQIVVIRRFEESCYAPYRQGKFGGYLHVYTGQEAVAVGFIANLTPQDRFICTYRDHAHAIARGTDPRQVMAELYGRATGCAHGKGGSMHLVDPERGFMGGYGIVGGNVPLAMGIGYAIRYRGGDEVCLCFFGEGSYNQGVVHESLNMASLYRCPVVFIVENNNYAMATSVERSSAVTNFAQRASQYGMPTEQIQGMDPIQVFHDAERIIADVRSNQHPAFVEVITYRFEGHGIADNTTNQALYRTREEVEQWRQRDPVIILGNYLIDHGIADEATLHAMDEEAKRIAADAINYANESPEPPIAALYRDVYTDMEVREWR